MFQHQSSAEELLKMNFVQKIKVLKEKLRNADAVAIGAGSGLSTAAGYVYTGERLTKYFGDFVQKYGFRDMYSGGFYPYATPEEFWGFWSRYIWLNRYAPIPTNLYQQLFLLIKDKNYFVLTTNVDHCFQRSGFDKQRLFYTQGDYGLLQSSDPQGNSLHRTYDNYDLIKQMILAEGFEINVNDELIIPENRDITMTVPTNLVPVCPDDGQPMTTNLRVDDKFVEDAGWHAAADRYRDFIENHQSQRVLYLELGVGMNTPGIIKYPFWRLTESNPRAFYASLNHGEAQTMEGIADRSILIDEGIDVAVQALLK